MVLAVYFTNWSIYARNYLPENLPLNYASHVLYAFFKPTEVGTVELSDSWADVEKPMPNNGLGCLGELQVLKRSKYQHIRILASIGGWTYSPVMAQIACNPRKRATFVQSAVDLVVKLQLDGIDLDWEFPSSREEVDAFIILIRELKGALYHANTSYELTIAVSAGQENRSRVPYAQIDDCISFYNLMAYDFAGPWSQRDDHHAALYPLGDDAVQYYTRFQRIHPHKIVLGIPLYGRSFARASKLHAKFKGQLPAAFEEGVHDFKTLPLPKSKEYVDKDAVGAYCVSRDGLVSYDNVETVTTKAKYIKANSLGGGMFWEASGDNGLVEAFAQELYRR